MALIIETGQGVAEANSYITLEEASRYANDRGVTVQPSGQLLGWIVVACDYLETYRDQYVGTPVKSDQSLSWPRLLLNPLRYWEGMTSTTLGTIIPTNYIPFRLKRAQCQLVIEQINGAKLFNSTDGKFIIRERVDVFDTTYSDNVGISQQPNFPAVKSLLQPLLWNKGVACVRG